MGICNFDTKKLKCERKIRECKLLIVGSGLAGLAAAHAAIESGLKKDEIIVLTKAEDRAEEQCNTYFAQGGIAVPRDDEDVIPHIKDTLSAGDGLCNEDAVTVLINEGRAAFGKLLKGGLKIDQEDGKPLYTREGGHSVPRVIHIKGDATGAELEKFMISKVRGNVTLLRGAFLVDLLVKDNKCYGGVVLLENRESDGNADGKGGGRKGNEKSGNGKIVIYAGATILAAGGYASLYPTTTNPEGTLGDGIAIAHRVGAETTHMEFIQFHPTTVHSSRQAVLVSEAVRGEGACIVDESGESFLEPYTLPGGKELRGELAPRDKVSQQVYRRVASGKKVFLDCRPIAKEHDRSYLKKRFPTIYENLKAIGIDMENDKIPIKPAAHFCMGGIKTGLDGRTSIDGLYACGETACNGAHGANRLASNSLLDTLVFGMKTGWDAGKYGDTKEHGKSRSGGQPDFKSTIEVRKGEFPFCKIKEVCGSAAGIVRTPKGILDGFSRLESLEKTSGISDTLESYRFWNALAVAKLILKSAAKRGKSIGAHCMEKDLRTGKRVNRGQKGSQEKERREKIKVVGFDLHGPIYRTSHVSLRAMLAEFVSEHGSETAKEEYQKFCGSYNESDKRYDALKGQIYAAGGPYPNGNITKSLAEQELEFLQYMKRMWTVLGNSFSKDELQKFIDKYAERLKLNRGVKKNLKKIKELGYETIIISTFPYMRRMLKSAGLLEPDMIDRISALTFRKGDDLPAEREQPWPEGWTDIELTFPIEGQNVDPYFCYSQKRVGELARQGVYAPILRGKTAVLSDFAAQHGCSLAECAFVGDGFPDLDVMMNAGSPILFKPQKPDAQDREFAEWICGKRKETVAVQNWEELYRCLESLGPAQQ